MYATISIVTVCALTAFVTLLMYLDGYWDRRRARIASLHRHDWPKWTTKFEATYVWGGGHAGYIQVRTCSSCGELATRKVTLPNG